MKRFITLVLLLLPSIAFAHPGHIAGDALTQGFLHPFSGVDHLMAMLASGMWAAQLGGRARALVPLSFVATMMLGAVAGVYGSALPFVETGIVFSVIALGMLVAFAVRAPQLLGAGVVAAFALLHGYSHGSEMAANSSVVVYVAGFALATVLLHAAAVFAVTLLQARRLDSVVRIAGTFVASVGVLLLAF